MECNYDECIAKKEILQLINGVKSLNIAKERYDDKFHQYEKHHMELMNQQTKMSGELVTIKLNMELQAKDREAKHLDLKQEIQNLGQNLINHTNDEMNKFDMIHQTFENIKESLSKDKLENDKVKWKVYAMWSLIAFIGLMYVDKVKKFLGL